MENRQETVMWLNPTDVTEDFDNLPDPADVGKRAAEIVDMVQGCGRYDRLVESAHLYCDGWQTYIGYPTISRWNLDKDFMPLFVEALRALCLKTAVFELTDGDEEAAELLIAAPVDEMVHAILAQHTLASPIETELDIRFVHMTDRERFGYKHGGYAWQCYVAAGWGEPNPRYWLTAEEMAVRLKKLNEGYEAMGIYNLGRNHNIDFDNTAA